MPTSEYNKKRDFSKTPEPKASARGRRIKEELATIFVVQEHSATTHHYDVRLEISGKLKSWAVPKGPSLDPSVKRLAILTEDHPMEYADFAGTIPKGQYGAGKVKIWDRGNYLNARECSMATAFKQGKIEVVFKGRKLKGKFALVRTKLGAETGAKNNWLMLKMHDD